MLTVQNNKRNLKICYLSRFSIGEITLGRSTLERKLGRERQEGLGRDETVAP